jgi:magnesium-transporting ATPase (P-type)
LGAFFLTLTWTGWHPGDAVGAHAPLHHGYQQATTTAWLGIVMCQVGVAFAARTDHASLRSVGFFTNRALLGAIGVTLLFATGLVYLPIAHSVFGTAALDPGHLAVVAPFAFVVWGADELRRLRRRRRSADPTPRELGTNDSDASATSAGC